MVIFTSNGIWLHSSCIVHIATSGCRDSLHYLPWKDLIYILFYLQYRKDLKWKQGFKEVRLEGCLAHLMLFNAKLYFRLIILGKDSVLRLLWNNFIQFFINPLLIKFNYVMFRILSTVNINIRKWLHHGSSIENSIDANNVI